MLDCSTWTHRHLHGRRIRLAIDRSSSARRPDHRDQQVGQARSSATPLLSDGDIMGFNSPGQFTHKPPQSAAAGASFLRFDHRIDGFVEGEGNIFRGNAQFLHLCFHIRVREKRANGILVVQVADERDDPGDESSNVVFLESAAGGIR